MFVITLYKYMITDRCGSETGSSSEIFFLTYFKYPSILVKLKAEKVPHR